MNMMRAVLLLAVLAAAVEANPCWRTRCISPHFCLVDDEVGHAHCVLENPCDRLTVCYTRCFVSRLLRANCEGDGFTPYTPPPTPRPTSKGCTVEGTGTTYPHGSTFTQQCLQCKCMDGVATDCVIIHGNAC